MGFINQPLSLSSILLKPQRQIANIKVQVILSENTSDVLTITKQPVQQGASITDHAFKEPTTLSMQMFFSPGGLVFGSGESLSTTYDKLLALQNSRIPFDVVTPKRVYKSMLFASLGNTTDKLTENTLAITATFQHIIIVQTSIVTVARSAQRSPGRTGKTENAGKKSFLFVGAEGINKLRGAP